MQEWSLLLFSMEAKYDYVDSHGNSETFRRYFDLLNTNLDLDPKISQIVYNNATFFPSSIYFHHNFGYDGKSLKIRIIKLIPMIFLTFSNFAYCNSFVRID